MVYGNIIEFGGDRRTLMRLLSVFDVDRPILTDTRKHLVIRDRRDHRMHRAAIRAFNHRTMKSDYQNMRAFFKSLACLYYAVFTFCGHCQVGFTLAALIRRMEGGSEQTGCESDQGSQGCGCNIFRRRAAFREMQRRPAAIACVYRNSRKRQLEIRTGGVDADFRHPHYVPAPIAKYRFTFHGSISLKFYVCILYLKKCPADLGGVESAGTHHENRLIHKGHFDPNKNIPSDPVCRKWQKGHKIDIFWDFFDIFAENPAKHRLSSELESPVACTRPSPRGMCMLQQITGDLTGMMQVPASKVLRYNTLRGKNTGNNQPGMPEKHG